jgi:hypothetical protein
MVETECRARDTHPELEQIYNCHVSFGNRLTLDEPSKTVSLKIESSTFPNQLGIDEKALSPRSLPTR